MKLKKFGALKAKIHQHIFEQVEKVVGADARWQAAKPDILKKIDAFIDELLRPFFT